MSFVESDACSVIEWGRDAASVGALRQWAGLPRSQDRQKVTNLDFELLRSAMRPVRGEVFRKAMADGRAWLLTIRGSTAMLIHYLWVVPR